MEFLDGGHVNDVGYLRQNNLNPYEVSGKLGRLYSRMIFVAGFVHSDPHPGNILIKNNGHGADVVLLDHGLYAVRNSHSPFSILDFLILILRLTAILSDPFGPVQMGVRETLAIDIERGQNTDAETL